jgi:hypothetical protein
MLIGRLGERGPGPEIDPPSLDVTVVVAQVAHRLAEFSQVAQLVQRVPGMTGESPEQVRAQHRRDHGAEPAGGLAADRPVRPVGQRPVARVDERHDLLAQVAVVAPGARGVDELAAAVSGPGVDEDHHRRRDVASGEYRVGCFRKGLPVRAAIAPHGQLPGVALKHIHARVALRRAVVTWGDIDPQRAARGIT